MAEFKLVLPKMGESVQEATILKWHKKPGDAVAVDDVVLEVATDKVDSDVPSPVAGTLLKILFEEGETVEVGKALAIIQTDQVVESATETEPSEPVAQSEEAASGQDDDDSDELTAQQEPEIEEEDKSGQEKEAPLPEPVKQPSRPAATAAAATGSRYYSPLVLNIANTENISMAELEKIPGSGKDGRVTKEDMLAYVERKRSGKTEVPVQPASASAVAAPGSGGSTPSASAKRTDEIIEMDRMRKLIAHHMIESKRTSAHVSSFVEADLTNVVIWRNRNKAAFQQREGFGLSYMPIFVEAIVNAIKDYPMINVSVDGDKIYKKKDINIGVATALPSGNLIVPVIRNADQKSLVGIARELNDIVERARNKQLKPDDTLGGTYTISNIGTFGNIIGTPIINQPQVAIMAVGSIVKKPAVLETEQGDVIAIRHMMYLSHTYDHRVVDGMLGGLFVKRVAEYLEGWDMKREI